MTTRRSSARSIPATSRFCTSSMRSDTLPLSTVDEYGETLHRRSRFPSFPVLPRCWSTASQKFAVRVQVDADQGGGARDFARRRALRRRQDQFQCAGRHSDRAQSQRQLGRQRRHRRRRPSYRNVVVAWRNGAPVRLNEIANVIDSVENDQNRKLVQRQARRSCWRSSGSPMPIPSRSSMRSRQSCRSSAPRSRPRSKCSRCSTARSRSAMR